MNRKRSIFAASALSMLMLAGCVSLPTAPELIARSKWKGRPAEDAVRFFGTPGDMQRSNDGERAVMSWYRNTSYSQREAVAYTQERQGNVLVNTTHMDDVHHSGRCIISVTVDKDKRIVDFKADAGKLLLSSGCAGIKLGPP
ncbi:MAG: hypothetical protein ACOH1V_01670 [Stenotrophomonas sp.]